MMELVYVVSARDMWFPQIRFKCHNNISFVLCAPPCFVAVAAADALGIETTAITFALSMRSFTIRSTRRLLLLNVCNTISIYLFRRNQKSRTECDLFRNDFHSYHMSVSVCSSSRLDSPILRWTTNTDDGWMIDKHSTAAHIDGLTFSMWFILHDAVFVLSSKVAIA